MEVVRTLIFLVSLALIYSCNSPDSPDCFKSRGSDEIVTRSLSTFDEIEVRDYLEIELVDSEVFKVEVSGGKNLLPKIKTRIESNRLIIENKNRCNFVRSFKHTPVITVYCPTIRKIILQDGAGELRSLGELSGDSILLETNHASGDITLHLDYDKAVFLMPTGTSDLQLSGTVEQLEIFSDAFGMVNTEAVEAEAVLVNNSSIRDFFIRTNRYFYAEINDRGNVYVSGNIEDSDVSINGSGKVIINE